MVQGTEHSPQVSKLQHEKVLSMIKQGREQGGQVLCGGERWGTKGYFIQPTVMICEFS